MKLGSRLSVLALATAAACILAIALTLAVVGPRSFTLRRYIVGEGVTTGKAAIGGPFTLVSTNGENVTDQSFRGKWLVMFFGYTSCPDVCPTALSNMSAALEKLGREANKLQPIFITVDPHRDTRAAMAEYLKSFDSRIIGLTGTQAQINDVVKEYRIYAASGKSETSGNDYLVSRSAYIYLMDPRGEFVNVIHGSESGDEIAAWMHREMSHRELMKRGW
jgi:protein SCO1/2